jgi:hypothetical protein
MAFNRYAAFYGAYNNSLKNGNTMSKEEVVLEFTESRTKSLQDLSEDELKALVSNLNELAGAKFVPITKDEKDRDKMRKAIIAQFHLMHRTPSHAVAWAEKMGVFGNKRKFNQYDKKELRQLIKNAEQVVEDWRKALLKKVL